MNTNVVLDPSKITSEMTFLSNNQKVGRDELEAMIWRMTGWRGDPETVEALLRLIDSYAASSSPPPPQLPAQRQPEPEVKLVINTGTSAADAAWVEALSAVEEPEEDVPVLTLGSAPSQAEEPVEQLDGKVCTRCDRFLSWDEFNKDNSRKDGKRGKCRACEKQDRLDRLSGRRQ